MGTNTGHVMTLANSIIGVSVLAMPFCYKQCGIVLASLMLIISSIMSRLACYYLIKSSILARRRTFEFLAFHTFGPTGKLTVELSIIGFMLGTCVAFFVVMGDLGPAILGPILNVENPASIRASVLIAIAMLVVLPLGLLRNVDSLAAISAATIAFYICLVLKVMGEATTHLLAWDWLDKVHLWRPSGLLQCIPIFSMALSCQTQLFEIFDSIPNATLDKMNVIVRSAANLCTLMYMAMGFFGYVAFCTQPFSGNLMLSFTPTATSEVIKMGFVLSVAVSFPLVIFPCRASLHSLLYRRGVPPHHELLSVSNHIPETRFKCITLVIVTVSLVTGIMIPNIELVLGLVGSTIGVLICIIIPATLFLCLTTKNNNERLLAQVLFVMGVLIMVLGSYANLYATEEVISANEPVQAKLPLIKPPELPALIELPKDSPPKAQIKDETLKDIKNVEQLAAALPKLIKETPAPAIAVEEKADVRKEPPIPEAPVVKVVSEAPVNIKDDRPKAAPVEGIKKIDPPVATEKPVEKKEEVIHNDAIKKEDDEIKEVEKQEILKKKEELIEKLEENEQKQKKLLEEQQKLLQDIKLEKEKLVEENKQLEEVNKESPVPKGIENNLNIQNEVIKEGKENEPALNQIPEVQNKPVVEIPKVTYMKKSDVNLKDSVNSIIKDDLVKKNMAEGVPLPIAIQQVAPHVEAIKSAKIVENPENPNEGNADTKMLRREILAESEVKEQREKRDIEEVINDVKDLNSKIKVSGEEKDNLNTLVMEEKTKINPEDNIDLPKEVPKVEENVGVVLVSKNEKEKVDSVVVAELSNIGKIEMPSEKLMNNVNEQCSDKTKTVNIKFSDELQPLKDKPAIEKTPESPETKDKTTMDSRLVKEAIINKEISTESIIKSPLYLSNPSLVLPGNNLQSGISDTNALNNEAKPMKRDLKSYDMTEQENKKESET